MLPMSRELWVEGHGPDREVRRMAELTETANRWSRTAGWGAALLIVLAVLVLMGTLPVDRGIDWLDRWIAGLGVWGPVAYGLVYAVAVVLLVPGWTLTVAAGALFGPGWGVVAVSWGATLGAALAFLIARYAARRRVAKVIERHPRFDAPTTCSASPRSDSGRMSWPAGCSCCPARSCTSSSVT
jgi:hypothetical protein